MFCKVVEISLSSSIETSIVVPLKLGWIAFPSSFKGSINFLNAFSIAFLLANLSIIFPPESLGRVIIKSLPILESRIFFIAAISSSGVKSFFTWKFLVVLIVVPPLLLIKTIMFWGVVEIDPLVKILKSVPLKLGWLTSPLVFEESTKILNFFKIAFRLSKILPVESLGRVIIKSFPVLASRIFCIDTISWLISSYLLTWKVFAVITPLLFFLTNTIMFWGVVEIGPPELFVASIVVPLKLGWLTSPSTFEGSINFLNFFSTAFLLSKLPIISPLESLGRVIIKSFPVLESRIFCIANTSSKSVNALFTWKVLIILRVVPPAFAIDTIMFWGMVEIGASTFIENFYCCSL